MSLTTITRTWQPAEKTITALRRRGLSPEQCAAVLIQFRKENHNKQVSDASSKFYAMFDKMHGHNMPKPDNSEDIKQAKERQANFANKAENSAERAVEVKEQKGGMTQDQAKAWINKQRGLPANHGLEIAK